VSGIKIGGGGAKRCFTRRHHPDAAKIHAYVQYPANSYFIRQVAAAVGSLSETHRHRRAWMSSAMPF